MTRALILAIAVTAFAGVAAIQTASAQYPPPEGSLQCVSSELSPPANGTAVISTVLRDTAGKPLAGRVVTFAITSGNGRLSASTAVTDSNGIASVTLFVGSAPGRVTVSAGSGAVQCQVALVSEVSTVTRLPPTGSGGLLDAGSSSTVLYLALGLPLAALLTSVGLLGLRARRASEIS